MSLLAEKDFDLAYLLLVGDKSLRALPEDQISFLPTVALLIAALSLTTRTLRRGPNHPTKTVSLDSLGFDRNGLWRFLPGIVALTVRLTLWSLILGYLAFKLSLFKWPNLSWEPTEGDLNNFPMFYVAIVAACQLRFWLPIRRLPTATSTFSRLAVQGCSAYLLIGLIAVPLFALLFSPVAAAYERNFIEASTLGPNAAMRRLAQQIGK